MMWSLASSARAMKLRCASALTLSKNPIFPPTKNVTRAEVPTSHPRTPTSSGMTNGWRNDCAAGLVCRLPMEDPLHKHGRFFDVWSNFYRRTLLGLELRRIQRLALDRLRTVPGQKVLDLGCGP